MKKSLLCLAACAVLPLAASVQPLRAQDNPPDQQQQHRGTGGGRRMAMDPDRRVQMLDKQLKLSDDQKSKLKQIFTDAQQQMEGLRGDSSLSREDRMAKMRSIREDADGKVKAVLTDEQKPKYEQMQQRMHERMQERQNNNQ